MLSMIETCIAHRWLLSFVYDGLPRVVEPHLVGYSTTGKQLLRAYQVDGQSESGRIPDWRLFEVGKMRSPGYQQTYFTPRPEYKPEDKQIPRVIARV